MFQGAMEQMMSGAEKVAADAGGCCAGAHAHHHVHTGHRGHADAKAGVRDPVCGMALDSAKATTAWLRGKPYHFCSDGCRRKMEQAPERYTDAP